MNCVSRKRNSDPSSTAVHVWVATLSNFALDYCCTLYVHNIQVYITEKNK